MLCTQTTPPRTNSLPIHNKSGMTRGNSFSIKKPLHVGMEVKKVQKQRRDYSTRED